MQEEKAALHLYHLPGATKMSHCLSYDEDAEKNRIRQEVTI